MALHQLLERDEDLVAEGSALIGVQHRAHLREELVLLLLVSVVRDLLLEDLELRHERLVVHVDCDQVGEHALHREVLLDRLAQLALEVLGHERRIEHLLLGGGVGRELVGELGEQCAAVAVTLLDLLEQLVDLGVLRGQQLDDIGGGVLAKQCSEEAHGGWMLQAGDHLRRSWIPQVRDSNAVPPALAALRSAAMIAG